MKKILRKIKNLPIDISFSKWKKIINNSTGLVQYQEVVPETMNKEIVVSGVKNKADIQHFFQKNPTIKHPLFIISLNQSNLYSFDVTTIRKYKILFFLREDLSSLEDRFHAYNLIHSSYTLRQHWFWMAYYHKLIVYLTQGGRLPNPSKISSYNTLKQQLNVLFDLVFTRFDIWLRILKNKAKWSSLFIKKSFPRTFKNSNHFLITGWYGTETAGDKAIMMEMIHAIKEGNPDARFSTTSINPGLSYLTNEEFDLDIKVHPLKKLNFWKLRDIDGILFGGGPLMDSSQLKYIEVLFKWAHSLGKMTFLFGCGVGPVKTKNGETWVKSILKNATGGFFRDEKSAKLGGEMGFKHETVWACDPALRYVTRKFSASNIQEGNPTKLIGLLRAQTKEYDKKSNELTQNSIKNYDEFFHQGLENKLIDSVSLLPMHTFWYGNDDRDFMSLVHEQRSDSLINISSDAYLLDDLIRLISTASIGMPMRFHGHIFYIGLKLPFISIDYTGPSGKIHALMERYELSDYSIDLRDLKSENELINLLRKVLNERSNISTQLDNQSKKDIAKLMNIYKSLGIH